MKSENLNRALEPIISRDDFYKLPAEIQKYYVTHHNVNLMQVRDDYELMIGAKPCVVKLELD